MAKYSDADQKRLDSGHYVVDPVFGVQPVVPVDYEGNPVVGEWPSGGGSVTTTASTPQTTPSTTTVSSTPTA